MAFDNIQFPVDISYGSSFTPSYRTDVIVLENKNEQRVSLDEFPTYNYDVAYGVKNRQQMVEVHKFFHGRKGMAHTFRFKDWLDFSATNSPVVVIGAETIQLTKQYVSGPTTLNRAIHKPIGPITMRRDTVTFTNFALDLNTGILTLTPDLTSSITSSALIAVSDVTNANPGVVTTSSPHGLETGNQVIPSSIGGTVEINGLELIVTVLTGTTFEISVNTTAFGVYTSGGNVIEPGITRQGSAVVRSIAHGLTSSDVVFIKDVNGMIEVNNQVQVITVIDADHFSIPVDSTNFTLYSSGGTVQKHVQPSEVLDWTGEFDVRVRFGTDSLPATLEAFEIGNVSPIALIGVRND